MKSLVPLFALALVFASSASSAWGVLGDTEAALAARYGKQTKTGTSKLPGVLIQGYRYKGFLIVVGVLNGRSAFEMYSKTDGAKLTGPEITAFLTANAGGGAWTLQEDAKFVGTKWELGDGSVSAEWPKNGSDLTVMSKEGADLMKSEPPKTAATPAPAPAPKK